MTRKRSHITHHLWETPNISFEIVLFPQSSPPNWQCPHLSPASKNLNVDAPLNKAKACPEESWPHFQICKDAHSSLSATTWSKGSPAVKRGNAVGKVSHSLHRKGNVFRGGETQVNSSEQRQHLLSLLYYKSFFFFFFKDLFIISLFLAASGLSCGTRDLRWGMWALRCGAWTSL